MNQLVALPDRPARSGHVGLRIRGDEGSAITVNFTSTTSKVPARPPIVRSGRAISQDRSPAEARGASLQKAVCVLPHRQNRKHAPTFLQMFVAPVQALVPNNFHATSAAGWSTSSFGSAPDASPLDSLDLSEHLDRCRHSRSALRVALPGGYGVQVSGFSAGHDPGRSRAGGRRCILVAVGAGC